VKTTREGRAPASKGRRGIRTRGRRIVAGRPRARAATHGARAAYGCAFLVSLAAILLEIAYTRIFSFKLFYYFSYLIIGISLLGLGMGAIAVSALRSRRDVDVAEGRLVAAACGWGAVAALLGYFVVALCPLNLFQLVHAVRAGQAEIALWEAAKLLAVCGVLLAPFLVVGVALSALFAARAQDIGRLYFADLLGAGVGCAIAIPAVSVLSPPGTVMLAALLLAVGGMAFAAQGTWRLGLAGVAAVCLAAMAVPDFLPDPVPDRIKIRPTRGEFFAWSPVFRVDLLRTPDPSGVLLVHDATLGASIRRFDGDVESLGFYAQDERSYPFRLLGPGAKVAIIGSAGGNEILASLYFGAEHVTAIELNPVTVALLRGPLADFSGNIASHPRVSLVHAEGRSFLQGSEDTYDLVWLVAPDSYAAMNAATASAFVLSESYLYTSDMVEAALRKLRPGGILCAQFGEVDFDRKPNRTARFLSGVREALRRHGVADPGRHVFVATAPHSARFASSTIVVRREPFVDADRVGLEEATAGIPGATIRFAAGTGAGPGESGGDPVHAILSLPAAELAAWYAEQPFDLRPVSDDAPFFWHFVRFADVVRGRSQPGTAVLEEGFGERILLALLGFAVLFAALALVFPVVALRGALRGARHKLGFGLYFAALGLGFMFVEISLMQRLTLFLGYPTHALTVTLFALLVSSGLGSLLSQRYPVRVATVVVLASALVVLVAVLESAVLPRLPDYLGWPLAARVAAVSIALAPLGLCLGAFLPLGVRAAAQHTSSAEPFVAWCWAVNAFFSVVGSVLATILSMSIGFASVASAGVGVYLVAAAALAGSLVTARPASEIPVRERAVG
jgi:hypothetical protein